MSDASEMATEKLPFFLTRNKNTKLGPIGPADDLLHPESFKGVSEDSATETQMFGFSVPEENIHAFCYMWWHPNLKVCTGGLLVFQGVKIATTQAELCDFRTFMSDKAIANDLHEFRFDNGYGVKILEPNQRFHITYDAPIQRNSVDLIAEAIMPGIMFGDGNHFEQTMKVRGRLLLRGKEYKVDSYYIRDRSWGKPRPETLMPVPPLSWMCATFNDTFSFNCSVFDQASRNPAIKGHLVMPDEHALNGGWVMRDGKLGRIVKASKRAARGPGQLICAGIELQFTDEHGREFDVRGRLLASCPYSPYTNNSAIMNLMHWDCDGMTGYGDNQEGFWNDYLNADSAI